MCLGCILWLTILVVSVQDYPFARGKIHGLEYVRKFPHLRAQTGVFSRVLRLRNSATMAIHNFFQGRGFIHVHTPVITSSDCEGAGELFEIRVSQIFLQIFN